MYCGQEQFGADAQPSSSCVSRSLSAALGYASLDAEWMRYLRNSLSAIFEYCTASNNRMEDRNILSLGQEEQYQIDPLKKFQIQSFISQQLISKLQSQVMRRFAKLYQAPIDCTIYESLYKNSKDVDRFLTLVMQEMLINLELANLPFLYEPFKRVNSFMSNIQQMTLSHFKRMSKQLESKEIIIQSYKERSNQPLGETIGIIGQEQLQKMKRTQAQEEQKSRYQYIDDEDFLRQLQNILKHRIYEQNYKSPMTTNQLLDIKERMEEMCNLTERISLTSLKNKIQIINNEQMLINNNHLISQLTKDLQDRFSKIFKGHYLQSINTNSEKIYALNMKRVKESMVSVETQNPENPFRRPREHISKDIEQKNKIIENLTNRANLYEKAIEENNRSMNKLQGEIDKYRVLCSELAKKQQQLQDDLANGVKVHSVKVVELEQQVRLRDANIKKLSDLLQAGGIKVSMTSMLSQTEDPEYANQQTQANEQQQEDGILAKIIQNHVRSRNRKRISKGVVEGDNFHKTIAKKKSTLTQHLIRFLQYLAITNSHLLTSILEKLEGVEFQRLKLGVEAIFHVEKEPQKKVFRNSSSQTHQYTDEEAKKRNPSFILESKGYRQSSMKRHISQKSSPPSSRIVTKHSIAVPKNEAQGENTSLVPSPIISRASLANSLIKEREKVVQQNECFSVEKENNKVLKSVNIFENISNHQPPSETAKTPITQPRVTKPIIVTKKFRQDSSMSKSVATPSKASQRNNTSHGLDNKQTIMVHRQKVSRHLKQSSLRHSRDNLHQLQPLHQIDEPPMEAVEEQRSSAATISMKQKITYPAPSIKHKIERHKTQPVLDTRNLKDSSFKKLKESQTQSKHIDSVIRPKFEDMGESQYWQKKTSKARRQPKNETFEVLTQIQGFRSRIPPKRSMLGVTPSHQRLMTVIPIDQVQNSKPKLEKFKTQSIQTLQSPSQ